MTDSTEVSAPVAAPVAEATEAPPEAVEGEESAPEEGKQPDDRETRSHRSLARKAEKIRRELAELRGQREMLEKEKLTLSEERQLAQRFRELSELSKKDRLAAARELGLDYDTMTKEMLEEASLDEPTKAMRRELAELKRERDEAKQRADEAAQAQRVREIRAQLTEEISGWSKADPATFKFTSQMDPQSLIRKMDAIVIEVRQKGGTVASDDDLRECLEVVELRQARKADKWRKLLGLTAAQATAKVVADEAPAPTNARRTLSSKDTGDAAKTPPKTMTKEERKRWAMELIPDPA